MPRPLQIHHRAFMHWYKPFWGWLCKTEKIVVPALSARPKAVSFTSPDVRDRVLAAKGDRRAIGCIVDVAADDTGEFLTRYRVLRWHDTIREE